jgi:(p)ppGpp synthase/HD superfamily hydrolase
MYTMDDTTPTGSGSAAPHAAPTSDLARFARAAHYAACAHRFQKRKGIDGEPYVNHCLEVAELVGLAADPGDAEVAIAALLHDTVEDTTLTEDDLVRDFGRRIADLVLAVTDDKTQPDDLRKRRQVAEAPSKPRDARLIRIADKISNLRALIRTPPVGWTAPRLAAYVRWGRQVVDACGPTDPVLEAMFAEAHAAAARVYPPVAADLRSVG